MKNSIIIDLDTDRPRRLTIAKNNVNEPENPEQAKKMIMDDIALVCEALCELINIADYNKYGVKSDLTNTSISLLRENISQPVNNESAPDSNPEENEFC